MTRRRIVVTGLGLVTPVGNTVDESWSNLLAGRSGIASLQRFDPAKAGSISRNPAATYSPRANPPKYHRRSLA